MAFSDLQIKVASETAVMGLQKHMASLKYFAKDLSPMSDRPFAGVQVPVYSLSAAAEFAEGTNDWCDKHLHYETDFKDNISHLNPKLNEMTSIWCYWKNLMEDADYIGFNHYRRLFDDEVLDDDISGYDIIDTRPIPMVFNMSYFTGSQIPNFVPTDIKNGYFICHKFEDWIKMEEQLKKTPYYAYFEDWSKQS